MKKKSSYHSGGKGNSVKLKFFGCFKMSWNKEETQPFCTNISWNLNNFEQLVRVVFMKFRQVLS